jgi:hypothetical protein
MRSTALPLRLAGAALLLLASAAPAAANDSSRAPADHAAGAESGAAVAPAPAAPAAKPAKKERRICRTVADTGSHARGHKVCRTARQWRASQD